LIGVLAMPRITISYRRDDSLDITGRIFDRLAGHFGRETVFRDIDSIPLGVDFRRHIDRVLDETDVILAIVGPRWIGRDNEQLRLSSPADPVRLEIETALRKDKPLIPVLVSRAVMPHEDVLPESLHNFVYRNAVQVDSGQDFDVHVGRLIRELERLLRINKERTADEAVQGARPLEPTPNAERPAEAARQAKEEKQRTEAVRQAEEEKQWTETTPKAEPPVASVAPPVGWPVIRAYGDHTVRWVLGLVVILGIIGASGIPLAALALGAVTYLFFHWLDGNASSQATRAISGWVRRQEYNNIEMQSAILTVFDHVYSWPLFSFNAFLRSSVISLITWLGFLVFYYGVFNLGGDPPDYVYSLTISDTIISFAMYFMFMFVVDYMSLFIVRKCLSIRGNYLIGRLILAFLSGVLVVFIFLCALEVSVSEMINFLHGEYTHGEYTSIDPKFVLELIRDPELLVPIAPAFLVHLWLILFAVGALGVRLLNPVFRLVAQAQWFLKQGDRHPLRAIGMVGAILVFGGNVLGKVLAFLSF
jgi:hypothetical protein